MRNIICDDDLIVVEKMQKYLKSYFNHLHLKCPEIISFSSGESLLADQRPKDIIFLDIEMNIWMRQCVFMYSVTFPNP